MNGPKNILKTNPARLLRRRPPIEISLEDLAMPWAEFYALPEEPDADKCERTGLTPSLRDDTPIV